jgi:trimeric autotransporter adhesin
LPSTGGLPYSISYITASADGVTSNPVTVYIHAPISSINLVTEPVPGSPAQGCYSQNQQANLDAQAYYSLNGTQTLICAPGSATLPECSNSIGTLSFASGNSSVASIDPTTNVITAEQPGTTVITATIAESASSAGYFSTCPPKSISIALANGSTKGVIAQGAAQNLTTTVTDTQGNSITGLALDYESTNPIEITSTGSGSITAAYPGVATLTALCKPPLCNPAPINELGINGTGLSITSNPVDVIVPGTTSDFVWFAAPNQSQYFSSIELLTGNPGSTVRMPFVPNSMVMDQAGSSLYFGSARELMIYSTQANTLTRQDTSVPGVVLAASPNANYLLINDQIRGLFYLYGTAGSINSTFGGLGAAAAWTQDSNTLYIVDSSSLGGNHTDTLYVHDANSGWSTYALPASPASWSANPALLTARTLAITVPGVGAWFSGNPTVDHTWCPSGIVGNNATILFYPQPAADSLNTQTDVLGATSDGQHVLGASLSGSSITLDDIGVNIPPSLAFPAAECPETTAGTTQTLAPLSTNPAQNGQVILSGVTNAIAVEQVVTGTAPTTASVTTAVPIAFVTYNAPGTSTTAAQLPYYLPQPAGVGPLGYVTFADNTSATPPTAPLAGTFSPDHSIFFVSTAGDDEIHFISIPPNLSLTSPPTDSQQVSPALPACTPVSAGGNDAGCLYPTAPAPNTVVPATVITAKPRPVT